tara:strand:+ start:513 stop:1148 length:636 start_codon:yes stop_codon:yes gene_type:complete
MKNILLIIIISLLGLHLEAQTLCSNNIGNYTIGTQSEPEVVFGVTGNGLPNMAPQYVFTTLGQTTFTDSCFGQPCSHKISNTLNEDTITTYLTYTLTDSVGAVSDLTCSLTQYWNGANWQWASESSLGIEDIQPATASVYPNPSNGLFTIQVGQEDIGSFYQILDNLGRLIDKGTIRELSQDFDLSDKPKGVYRIQVSNEKAIKTLNVVIQ